MQDQTCGWVALGSQNNLTGAGHIDEAQPGELQMKIVWAGAAGWHAGERVMKRAAAIRVCLAG